MYWWQEAEGQEQVVRRLKGIVIITILLLITTFSSFTNNLAINFELVNLLNRAQEWNLTPCDCDSRHMAALWSSYQSTLRTHSVERHDLEWKEIETLRTVLLVDGSESGKLHNNNRIALYIVNLAMHCSTKPLSQLENWWDLSSQYVVSTGDVIILQGLAESYFKVQRWEDALPIYEELVRRGVANASVHLQLGIIYRVLGRNEQAIEVLEEGLGLPNADRIHFLTLIGHSYLIIGKPEQSLLVLERAEKELKDSNGQHAISSRLFYYKGLALTQIEQSEAAIEAFEKSLIFDPFYKASLQKLIHHAIIKRDYINANLYLSRLEIQEETDQEFLCLAYATKIGIHDYIEANKLRTEIEKAGFPCFDLKK